MKTIDTLQISDRKVATTQTTVDDEDLLIQYGTEGKAREHIAEKIEHGVIVLGRG